MPLTFGTPVRLEPTLMQSGWRAYEVPGDRSTKRIVKDRATTPALAIQSFDPSLGWQTQETLSLSQFSADSTFNTDVNQFGDLVILYFDDAKNLRAFWRDGQGLIADVYASIDPVAGAGIEPTFWRSAVVAIDDGGRDFYVYYSYGGASGQALRRRRFDFMSLGWTSPTDFNPPGFAGNLTASPVVAQYQRLDGSVHIAMLTAVAFSTQDVWYGWWDAADAFQGWTKITNVGGGWPNRGMAIGTNELDMVVDEVDARQVYIVSVYFNTNPAQWQNCEVYFLEKDLTTDPPPWKAPAVLSNATTQGAHYPTVLCDTNGDVYLVWRERDPVSGFQSVYVRKRPYLGAWETPQIVGVSSHETSAGSTDDIEWPGIIRPPRGLPLLDLCITWGDSEATIDYTYVNCAVVRTIDGGGGFGPSSLRELNAIYVRDELAGGPWSRWKGPAVRPLNATRFLVLDPHLDNEQLLFASSEATGAWLNELDTGYVDLDTPFELRWTTPKYIDGDLGLPKVFRFIRYRIEGVTDPLTMTWTADGGRATGSFLIADNGWRVVPLPQRCQGRVLELLISLTSSQASPKMHQLSVAYWPKRQMWPRRP